MNKKVLILIVLGNLVWSGFNIATTKIPRIDVDVGKNEESTLVETLHKTKMKLRVADTRAEYLEKLLDSKIKKEKQK
jgi:hypothetical protein